MIEISHLSKVFGTLKAVDDISLTIDTGEVLGFLGPNGAGKSTLAHLLLRFIEPTSGTILIDGVEIAKLDPVQLREHIALVAQHTLL